jgi:hypothetical protein
MAHKYLGLQYTCRVFLYMYEESNLNLKFKKFDTSSNSYRTNVWSVV